MTECQTLEKGSDLGTRISSGFFSHVVRGGLSTYSTLLKPWDKLATMGMGYKISVCPEIKSYLPHADVAVI